MPKKRTGWITKRDGKLYARITYVDSNGKQRELMRRVKDEAEGKLTLKQLRKDLKIPIQREERIQGAKMTFAALHDKYKTAKVTSPTYSGDRKIAGMRAWKKVLSQLKPLLTYFEKKRVNAISPSDLEAYRLHRLSTPKLRPIHGNSERSITQVNRELSRLKAMLNYAKRQGWLSEQNPFELAEGIITPSDEIKRNRILSSEEERRLLAVCVQKRAHLRPLLIAALDTGMRRGELLSLEWSGVNLQRRIIRLKAFNTKTAKSREVPITNRLAQELEQLCNSNQVTSSKNSTLVFGGISEVKRSFTTACRLADVENFHLHDCRHTFATRLIQLGISIAEVARLLGHSSLSMSYRYINLTEDTVTRAANLLNRLM